MAPRLERTRTELAEFLKSRRERITPEEVGLPASGRRRTPGLRREEVAALAGVGITWYTWLEQGREIGVSSKFLDELCRVLKLDAAERRHLYMLTQRRPPQEPTRTACEVPGIARNLMDKLYDSPAYVLNLKWDILAWNQAAEQLFEFSEVPDEHRNMLWVVFTDERFRNLLDPWEEQAREILTSFKRDYVQAPQDGAVASLVDNLTKIDRTFDQWWKRPDIDGLCSGIRTFKIPHLGKTTLNHMSMTLESDRHLRLVYYNIASAAEQAPFTEWLVKDS